MSRKAVRYYFRTDGNVQIGAGHLMRCLTIADALSAYLGSAQNIYFVTADERSADLVSARNFQAIVLKTDYRRMEDELPVLSNLLGMQDVLNCILIDSYYVTENYLRALKVFGKIFLLEDMGQTAYEADAVVNYNAFVSPDKYESLYKNRNTVCYLGSKYIPIRPQFLTAVYVFREKIENILITVGGGDGDNIAGAVLSAIQDNQCHYHVVAGHFHPYLEEWKDLERKNTRVHFYYDVSDMASLMCRCELAVTAGGTTVYELAALGVPFICFSCAENQEALTRYVGDMGIAGYAGAYHKEPIKVLKELKAQVSELFCDTVKRKHYHESEKAMVDGKGAYRLAGLLASVYGKTW